MGMDLDKYLDYAWGNLVVALGRGNAKQELGSIIVQVVEATFQRGIEEQKKRMKDEKDSN